MKKKTQSTVNVCKVGVGCAGRVDAALSSSLRSLNYLLNGNSAGLNTRHSKK